MNSNGYSLPYAENLDINSFARLFDDKATSYKLIFFYSILEILRKNFFDSSKAIALQDVNVEMLVHAWYPHTVFGLSFGYQDTIADKLDALRIKLEKPLLEVTQNDKQVLREIISSEMESENYQINKHRDLRRYVPFRLIRPFFPETRGIKDSQVKKEVARLSRDLFCSRKPLYKISEDFENIYFHPDWSNYLQQNYQIVHGWTVWNWMSYMQGRNPNTPGIANKIFPPLEEREPLSEQRRY